MTPFALLLLTCGLTTREAAGLFNQKHGLVDSWADGSVATPTAILGELRWLYGQILESVENQLREINERLAGYSAIGKPPVVDIEMPGNDQEALTMGMPCVGLCRARAGILIARLDATVRLNVR